VPDDFTATNSSTASDKSIDIIIDAGMLGKRYANAQPTSTLSVLCVPYHHCCGIGRADDTTVARPTLGIFIPGKVVRQVGRAHAFACPTFHRTNSSRPSDNSIDIIYLDAWNVGQNATLYAPTYIYFAYNVESTPSGIRSDNVSLFAQPSFGIIDMHYRRAKTPGATYFFTVLTFRRRQNPVANLKTRELCERLSV